MTSSLITLRPDSAVKLHAKIYSAKLEGGFRLAFNPFSYNRPVVYPERFGLLFRSLKKPATVKKFLDHAVSQGFTHSEAVDFLKLMAEYNIIATDGRQNIMTPNPAGTRYWRFTVWLHLTNDCNFRCKYCFVDKNPEKMSLPQLKHSVDKIVETALRHKIKRITFVLGGGEPLLQFPMIKDLNTYSQELAKKNKLSIRLAIITNGALLTEKVAQYFKDNKVIVGISADGSEEYHNQTRVFRDGSGTFKQVQRGLEIANRYDVLSNISITATADNIKGLPDFISYILRLNPKIRIMLGLVKNTGLSSYHKKQHDDLVMRELKKTYRLIEEFYAKYDLSLSYLNFHKLLDAVFLYDPSSLHCGAGEYYLTITHHGKLKLCPSLEDSTAIAIRDEDDLIDLARKNNFLYPEEMKVDDIAKCRSCMWKYICRGGCPSEKFTMGVDIKSQPADYCRVYKTMIPYQVRLEGRRLMRSMVKKMNENGK